jgi:hypothetical protein
MTCETARLLMLEVNRALSVNGLNRPDWWGDQATRAEYLRIQQLASRAYTAADEATCAIRVSGPATLEDHVYTDHDRTRLQRAAQSLYDQSAAAWDAWRN